MKKILIIGSQGYLGAALYNYLSKKKDLKIFGIDNKLYGNVSYFKNKNKFKKIDIRDISLKFIKKFDVVICLAGLSHNPIPKNDKKKIYNVTKKYTKDLAIKCLKLKKKLIFPSSCSVFGFLKNKTANEKTKINPLTYYSKNKIEIEKILKKLSDRKNFNPIVLRISTVFGFSPSPRFDLAINMFMGMAITQKKIILNSNGLANRPFIEINDLCEIFYKFIYYKNKKFEIFNVGNNYYNFSILEIAKKISKLTGTKVDQKQSSQVSLINKDELIKNYRDQRSYRVSFNKIKNKLNIKFKNDLNKKIKQNLNLLKKIKLTESKFNNQNFYRLKKIKHLIKIKKINKNLRVI